MGSSTFSLVLALLFSFLSLSFQKNVAIVKEDTAAGWVKVNPAVSLNLADSVSYKGLFIVAGGNTWLTVGTSKDGITWTSYDIPVPAPTQEETSYQWTIAADDNVGVIILGAAWSYVTSTDGINWTWQNSSNYHTMEYAYCAAGQCLGYNGTFFSPGEFFITHDLQTWTLLTYEQDPNGYFESFGGKMVLFQNNKFWNWASNDSWVQFADMNSALQPFQQFSIVDFTQGPGNTVYLWAMDQFYSIPYMFLFSTTDWKTVDALAMAQFYYTTRILYGNGAIVASGERSYNITSDLGRNWVSTTCFANWAYPKQCGMRFINNKFVLTGDEGILQTSSDGFQWNLLSSIADYFQHLTVAQNSYYLFTYSVSSTVPFINAYTSKDGTQWTISPENSFKPPYESLLEGPDYNAGLGMWIATFLDTNYTWTPLLSKDLQNWAPLSLPGNPRVIQDIVYENGIYVVTAEISYEEGWALFTSKDNGKTWATQKIPYQGYGAVFASYGNGHFVVAGPNFTIVSTDASKWSTYTTPAPCYELLFIGPASNGLFFCAPHWGVPTMVSQNGTAWNTFNVPNIFAPQTFQHILYDGQNYVVSGQYSSQMLTSHDGKTWTATTSYNTVGMDYSATNPGVSTVIASQTDGKILTKLN